MIFFILKCGNDLETLISQHWHIILKNGNGAERKVRKIHLEEITDFLHPQLLLSRNLCRAYGDNCRKT